MRTRWAFLLLAGVFATSDAVAARALRTKTGAAAHWESTTVTVAADAAGKSAHLQAESVDQALDAALASWNAIPEMRVHFARPTGAPPQITVRFCKGTWTHPAGLLGHTEFDAEADTGIVAGAVVEVNECDYHFVGPDELEEGAFDLQAVLTHELGHALGLAHSEDPAAVMFSSTGSPRQRKLTLDDRSGISEIYGTPLGGPMKAAPGKPAVKVAVTSKDGLPPPPSPPPSPSPSPPKAPSPKPKRTATALPEGTVDVVRLDGEGGMLLVTAEPTILPAIATPEPEAAAPTKATRKARKARRAVMPR